MNIRFEKIGKGGLDLTWDLEPTQLSSALDELNCGFELPERALPTPVSSQLKTIGRKVKLRLQTAIELKGSCGRCLEPCELSISPEAELLLFPASELEGQAIGLPGQDAEELGEGAASGSFELESADHDVYTDGVIQLWPLLREQILLALPDYLLCSEACEGLCPKCGTNKNIRACECDTRVPDPRLAGLADIVLEPTKSS